MWTDELSIGIADIDTQHRALFSQLESLLDACVNGRELEEVSRMLAFLDGYVATHFETEETLQRDYGYPGYPGHRDEHEVFLRALARFEQDLEAEGPNRNLVLQINQMLIDWLKKHILDADKEAGAYLLERMATGVPSGV